MRLTRRRQMAISFTIEWGAGRGGGGGGQQERHRRSKAILGISETWRAVGWSVGRSVVNSSQQDIVTAAADRQTDRQTDGRTDGRTDEKAAGSRPPPPPIRKAEGGQRSEGRRESPFRRSKGQKAERWQRRRRRRNGGLNQMYVTSYQRTHLQRASDKEGQTGNWIAAFRHQSRRRARRHVRIVEHSIAPFARAVSFVSFEGIAVRRARLSLDQLIGFVSLKLNRSIEQESFATVQIQKKLNCYPRN